MFLRTIPAGSLWFYVRACLKRETKSTVALFHLLLRYTQWLQIKALQSCHYL